MVTLLVWKRYVFIKYWAKIDSKIFEISALLSRKSGELETSKWCTTAGLALAWYNNGYIC